MPLRGQFKATSAALQQDFAVVRQPSDRILIRAKPEKPPFVPLGKLIGKAEPG